MTPGLHISKELKCRDVMPTKRPDDLKRRRYARNATPRHNAHPPPPHDVMTSERCVRHDATVLFSHEGMVLQSF